jgi:hypothetical protein
VCEGVGKAEEGKGREERKGKEGGNRVKREKRGGCDVEDVSPPVRTAPNDDDSPLDDSLPL